MNDERYAAPLLIGAVLHDLAVEAETVLLLARALEDQASGIPTNAAPQKLRESAALVKSGALQLGLAAANIVGSAERLRFVAEFADVDEPNSGELPS